MVGSSLGTHGLSFPISHHVPSKKKCMQDIYTIRKVMGSPQPHAPWTKEAGDTCCTDAGYSWWGICEGKGCCKPMVNLPVSTKPKSSAWSLYIDKLFLCTPHYIHIIHYSKHSILKNFRNNKHGISQKGLVQILGRWLDIAKQYNMRSIKSVLCYY